MVLFVWMQILASVKPISFQDFKRMSSAYNQSQQSVFNSQPKQWHFRITKLRFKSGILQANRGLEPSLMHTIKVPQVPLLFSIWQEDLLLKISQNGSSNWSKIQHKISWVYSSVINFFIQGNKCDLTENRGVKL